MAGLVPAIHVLKWADRRVGKANGSRECAPDGVPTMEAAHRRWWARREGRLCPPYDFRQFACLLSTDTKNPSVPVRRGVISRPSGDCRVAATKSSALSHSTAAVCAEGTTVNSG
jgi:hypothetical protein